MKKEHVVILIAVGSGLLATILVFNFLKSARQVTGRFIVAQVAISKGQLIQEQDLRLSKVLKKSETGNLFLDVQDVIGQTARKNISAGNLIYRSDVGRQEAKSAEVPQKRALAIPKGMRGLTLSRDNITNIPDLLDIGSYVDVVGLTDPYSQEVSTILVSRQVISINPLNNESPIESVTLAVMPDEAEKALEAASIKRLQLLVREDRVEQRPFEASMGSVEIIRGVQKEGAFRR